MKTQTKRRHSVPLATDTEQVLQALRTPGSRERRALARMADRRNIVLPQSKTPSEAQTLSALVELGKQALREEMLEADYRAIAAEWDDEDRAVHAALRRRRRSLPRDGV